MIAAPPVAIVFLAQSFPYLLSVSWINNVFIRQRGGNAITSKSVVPILKARSTKLRDKPTITSWQRVIYASVRHGRFEVAFWCEL
jgi:hypothetical protein